MTIYALGTGRAPLHEIEGEFAALRAAERGARPSRFHRPVISSSPSASETDAHGIAEALLGLGGLTDADSERIWVLLILMWDEVPSFRPSISTIREAMARNGLIPVCPSKTLYSASTPSFSSPVSFTSRQDNASPAPSPPPTRMLVEPVTIWHSVQRSQLLVTQSQVVSPSPIPLLSSRLSTLVRG